MPGILIFSYSGTQLFAQPISISVDDEHQGLLTLDSANWNEAWIEMDGVSPKAKKLDIADITVLGGDRYAEVLSIDSVGARWKSKIAISFVLDNSGSMFQAYDSLTQNCDSILRYMPPGAIGQAFTFDTRARSVTHLYTKEHSTFIAQKYFTDSFTQLSKFWHYYDTVRTQFTPLCDAIAAAATNIEQLRIKNSKPRNDVLLVVTDGDDNASRESIELLQQLLSSAHLRLFAINFRTTDDNRLDWLARKSGGEFFVCDNIAELRKLLQKIGLEMTREYHVTYRFRSLRPSGPRR